MTNQEFIKTIAPIVQKMARKYGYGVPSAIIAQACLESAYGTSAKAKHHNYFGLKYRPNRVTCSNGTFTDGSKEQNKDGSYVKITDSWFSFATMEKGVEGYLQFISIENYAAARKAKDPKAYLQALKNAGYATSITYVDSTMAVIEKWKLTQYDSQEETEKKTSKPTIKSAANSEIKSFRKVGFTDAEILEIQKVISQKLTKSTTKTYTIKKGDTLSKIASKYGTTVTDLSKKNGISDPNKIYVGQVIKL